jgi:glycogen(starch) synthase
MRVLQLGPVPPPHGGVQANMSAIHERLLAAGADAFLIAVTRGEKAPAKEDSRVLRPQTAFELMKILFNSKADIIHLHFGGDFTLRLAALAFAAASLTRAKTVLTFHSGGFASSAAGKAAKFLSLRGFAVRRLDKIVAVNEEIIRLFEKYGVKREKIALVAPHALREPNPAIEIPENLQKFVKYHSPLLLTASWLEPHYDLPLQIKAMRFVLRQFPRAGLLIAGSGEQERELRKVIAAEDYAKNILLAGDVPHEVLLHLIKSADVLLRTTRFDGDAISVREALFLGTPVVASDNRMRPEGVFLFKIGDLRELETAIFAALNAGKKPRAESSDGWKNINQILQIYQDLLKSK